MERSLGPRLVLAMAVIAAAVCGSVAQASVNGDSISVAFARDEPPGTPGCMLAPTDVAGAAGYASANWNNTVGGADTLPGLVRDTNGVATTTTASVTWQSIGTWSTESFPPGRSEFNNSFTGADETLMTGYLDTTSLAGGGLTTITITGLPADMAAGYSVVIYTLGGVVNRPADYFVNDAAMANPKHLVPGGASTYKHMYNGSYVQALGTDPDFGTTGLTDDFGNYVVFTGMNGDATIMAQPQNFRAVINAVQIVKNP
jgi:hypothetical protein